MGASRAQVRVWSIISGRRLTAFLIVVNLIVIGQRSGLQFLLPRQIVPVIHNQPLSLQTPLPELLSIPKPALPPACDAYPEVSDLVIVVKTGASEVFQKIPTLLLTYLQCAKEDALIFSDMAQTIGTVQIHDALASVSEKHKNDNKDFNLYRMQQEQMKMGGELPVMDGTAAWTLDKYKNLHQAQRAWAMKPDRKWYFFVDADTYVVWSSLFAWLDRLDAQEALYMGSMITAGNSFAHGGSGYLLSNAAMKLLVGEDQVELSANHDERTRDALYGDYQLAETLRIKGVEGTQCHPMINGRRPVIMDFGPKEWCQPSITAHHMQPEAINNLWHLENQRALDMTTPSPLLIADIFKSPENPPLPAYRADWDNRSEDFIFKRPTAAPSSSPDLDEAAIEEANEKREEYDDDEKPWESFNECKKACKEKDDCMMWRFTEDECVLSVSFRLGVYKKPATDWEGMVVRMWESGWDLERIDRWVKDQRCEEPEWVS